MNAHPSDLRDTARNAWIVVDIQHDFLPGGALAVPDGKVGEVIGPHTRAAVSG